MRRHLRLCALRCAGVATLFCAVATAGEIRDPDGRPVAFLLVRQGERTAYTDARGRHPFDGAVELPSERGFGPGLRGTRRLEGRVTAARPESVVLTLDYLLVTGLDTTETIPAVRRVSLDETGEFTLDALRPGRYVLRAEAPRHAPAEVELSLFAATTRFRRRLQPGFFLRGHVRPSFDVADEEPRRTILWIRPRGGRPERRVECAADGAFSAGPLGAGPHRVFARHVHGMFGEDETYTERWFDVDLAARTPAVDWRIAADRPVSFSVIGLTRTEGSVLVREWPARDREPFFFHVHENGIFRGRRGGFFDYSRARRPKSIPLEGFGPGRYTLEIRARGARTRTESLEVTGATQLHVALERAPGRTVRLVDPPGEWRLVSDRGERFADGDAYVHLAAGRHELALWSPRFRIARLTVAVEDGAEPLPLRFERDPGATLSGNVRTGRGDPLADGIVTLRPEPASSFPPRLGLVRNGRYEITGLAPGRYTLGPISAKVVIGNRRNAVQDLQLPR